VLEPATIVAMIEYIHNNPVRRGLVQQPTEWVWSSARFYAGETRVPIRMDPRDSTSFVLTRNCGAWAAGRFGMLSRCRGRHAGLAQDPRKQGTRRLQQGTRLFSKDFEKRGAAPLSEQSTASGGH
jgi:hypothetical protein